MIRKRDSRSLCQARKHETKHSEKEVILAVHTNRHLEKFYA